MSGRHAREAKRLKWLFGSRMTRLIAYCQRWKKTRESYRWWKEIPPYPKTRGKRSKL